MKPSLGYRVTLATARDSQPPRESGLFLTVVKRPAPVRASGMPVAVFVIVFCAIYAITAWALAFFR